MRALGLEQCQIGAPDQHVLGAAARRLGDARRGRHHRSAVDGISQLVAQFLGKVEPVDGRAAGDDHCELVSTDPAGNVVGLHGSSQAVCQRPDHLVAGLVPDAVVDLFETVHVHHDQHGGALLELGVEPLMERAVVEHQREAVGQRGATQPFELGGLGLIQGGLVADDARPGQQEQQPEHRAEQRLAKDHRLGSASGLECGDRPGAMAGGGIGDLHHHPGLNLLERGPCRSAAAKFSSVMALRVSAPELAVEAGQLAAQTCRCLPVDRGPVGSDLIDRVAQLRDRTGNLCCFAGRAGQLHVALDHDQPRQSDPAALIRVVEPGRPGRVIGRITSRERKPRR